MFRAIRSRLARFLASFRPPERRQVGALCWRRGETGIEILLVTTRRTGRWTPPKGGLMDGKSPAEAAAIEAWEEAGAIGAIESAPFGHYTYLKYRDPTLWEPIIVDMFAHEVEATEKSYPEKKQRLRQWFSQVKAAEMVNESTLKKLIRQFDPTKIC